MVHIHYCRLMTFRRYRQRVFNTTFNAWIHVYDKVQEQNHLCDRIYAFHSQRTIFQHWQSFVQEKFAVRKSNVIEWKEVQLQRTMWRTWQSMLSLKRRDYRIQQTLHRQKLKRHWQAWHQWFKQEKKMQIKVMILIRRRITPWFDDWKMKVSYTLLIIDMFGLK